MQAVLGWLGSTLGSMVRGGKLHAAFSPPSFGMLTALRSACEQHEQLAVRHMPLLWLACAHTLMVTLVTVLELDIAFDVPADLLKVEPRWMLLAMSVAAFFASFIVTFVYLLAWAMVRELSSPFGADSDDDFNPDAWLASTERTLFASLRSSLDQPLIEGLKGLEPTKH